MVRRLDISFLQSIFFSRDLEQGTAKRKEYIYSLDVASDSSDCQTEIASSTKSPDHSTSLSEGQVATVRRCARLNCAMKPRFDSIFCSDACGVSALESDLLQTLEYANVIHPSFLR